MGFKSEAQLEQTARDDLRRRAQLLQDVLGRENLPKLPHDFAEMVRWILNAQAYKCLRNECAGLGIGVSTRVEDPFHGQPDHPGLARMD